MDKQKKQQLVLRSWQLGSEDNGDYVPGEKSEPVRLWILMFDQKAEVETAIPNGQGWIRIVLYNSMGLE